jgi:hypothetical protein
MTWKWAPITTIPTTLINCSRLASIEVVPTSSRLARLSAKASQLGGIERRLFLRLTLSVTASHALPVLHDSALESDSSAAQEQSTCALQLFGHQRLARSCRGMTQSGHLSSTCNCQDASGSLPSKVGVRFVTTLSRVDTCRR